MKIVKTDSVMCIVIDEWRKETERRVEALRMMAKEIVDPLSYDQFVVAVQKVLSGASGNPTPSKSNKKQTEDTVALGSGAFNFALMYTAFPSSPILEHTSADPPQGIDIDSFLGRIMKQLLVRFPLSIGVPNVNLEMSTDLQEMLKGVWETFQEPVMKVLMVRYLGFFLDARATSMFLAHSLLW